jgi:hypothetical protein
MVLGFAPKEAVSTLGDTFLITIFIIVTEDSWAWAAEIPAAKIQINKNNLFIVFFFVSIQ